MNLTNTTWRAARCATLLFVALGLARPARGLDKVPWDLTTKVGPDAEVPGWYINLGLTGARAKLTQEDPKVLLAMFVFQDAPARGKLEKGDKIVGANGRPFETPHKFGYGMGKFGYEGPMMDLGNDPGAQGEAAPNNRCEADRAQSGRKRLSAIMRIRVAVAFSRRASP